MSKTVPFHVTKSYVGKNFNVLPKSWPDNGDHLPRPYCIENTKTNAILKLFICRAILCFSKSLKFIQKNLFFTLWLINTKQNKLANSSTHDYERCTLKTTKHGDEIVGHTWKSKIHIDQSFIVQVEHFIWFLFSKLFSNRWIVSVIWLRQTSHASLHWIIVILK